MPRIISPFLALLLAGCAAQAQDEAPYPPESRCEQVAGDGSCTIYGVSLVELIADPQTWDGRRVRVVGYLNLEFEGDAIYLHQEDHAHSIHSNGLWVGFASDTPRQPACNRRYVLIEGTFSARHTGHMGLWSGAILDIDRCMVGR